jgi:ATP-dependent Lon protease
MPKIMKSEEHLAQGIGLAADYFAEIIHEMRKESFRDIIEAHIEYGDNFTIRDENAVRKLASALIKLLFPNREFNNNELAQVLNLAVEMRQYIVDELSEMSPIEFPRKNLEVKVKG